MILMTMMIFCHKEYTMTISESILLAVCFGYVVGDILSNLIVIISDVVKGIKQRKFNNK